MPESCFSFMNGGIAIGCLGFFLLSLLLLHSIPFFDCWQSIGGVGFQLILA